MRIRRIPRSWAVVAAAIIAASVGAATPPASAAAAHAAGQTSQATASLPARAAASDTARAAHAAPVPPVAQHPYQAVCARPSRVGEAACLGLRRTDVKPHKGLFRPGVTAQATPTGYGPSDLQSAYNLSSAAAGSGATVAVVDAYNDPNIAADLNTYRTQYGLPACTTTSGCFQVVNQNGQASPLPANAGTTGWDQEESLDVEMVSAICPNCHIILVEANSANNSDLYPAEDAAVNLGAKFVSNSWAVCEYSGQTSDDQYFNHPGVVIAAASGDWGYLNQAPPASCDTPSYPATSQYVTAVGGTTLTQDSSVPRGWTETVWGTAANGKQGTGSGCSGYDAQPSWQAELTSGCANRDDNDISAVADPNTGVAVYDSYSLAGGWAEFGGTSVATPIIASTYALAGLPASGTYPASYLYDNSHANPAQFNDVTSGADGTCTPAVQCTAGPGWDGPTGLGTPDGITGFTSPAGIGSITGTVTDSSTGQPVGGASVSAPGLSATTGSDGSYTLSGLPSGSYQVTISAYGYQTQTVAVTVTAGQATTQNVQLTGTPHVTVSGTVSGGAPTAWPLYAQVSWSDGNGHGGTTYTTPGTGKYSLSLLENSSYRLTVIPGYPGYTAPAAATVAVAASNVTQDFTAGVDLLACTAIGYQATNTGTTQPFDSTSAPAGWTVTNTGLGYPGYTSTPGWVFNNPGGRANDTGGTGSFAIVDSDFYGAHHYQDTYLTSPVINMTADTTPVVQFDSNLQPAVNSTATVGVSADGGRTWSTVWTNAGFPADPGPATRDIALPQAAGKPDVRVRFGYLGEWSQYWQIDNVFAGQHTCAEQAGALLVGQVADGSGNAVNGATVASVTDPAETAVTVATPGDASVNGGLYWLFVKETGSQQFTAADAGYATATQSATVTAGQVTTLKFTLTAASG